MAEVLGVVAAAAQLASACLGLLQLTEKIKSSSSTLLRYQNQFQELHALSLSISQNPLLQTEEVFSHTQSLLIFLQHIPLEPLLQKGLLSRTWGFIRKDQYLSETSNCLEQRKSSLSLIISDIQARAIYDIRADIRVLSHCTTDLPLYQDPSDKPSLPDCAYNDDTKSFASMPGRFCNKSSRRNKSHSSTMSNSQQQESVQGSQGSPSAPNLSTTASLGATGATGAIGEQTHGNDWGSIDTPGSTARWTMILEERIRSASNLTAYSGNTVTDANMRNGHCRDSKGWVPGGNNMWLNNTAINCRKMINHCDTPYQDVNSPDDHGHAAAAGSSKAVTGYLTLYANNHLKGRTVKGGDEDFPESWMVNGYCEDASPMDSHGKANENATQPGKHEDK
ncbi:predicted protein [Verticillium alfalfae VaMs.102]|uniref:Predicted protein n=1 Tax=Verticillium alfalfae (strain VaMs.102 / ATCC MYA-4576 / FGSC 10136) TaxID=526221 RepID=C9SK41_VERA1|nr:predicted protein [Verticillium alfalfae VaMs.102]EEY19059.1 predicted protein [Verticillium alfalfae VaMs.102]